jgi:hypothetical protein
MVITISSVGHVCILAVCCRRQPAAASLAPASCCCWLLLLAPRPPKRGQVFWRELAARTSC